MFTLLQALGGLQALSYLPKMIEDDNFREDDRDYDDSSRGSSRRRSIVIEEGSVFEKLTTATYVSATAYLVYKISKILSRKHAYRSDGYIPLVSGGEMRDRLSETKANTLFGFPGDEYFVNDEGLVLRLTRWPATRGAHHQGKVLLVHGLGDHCGHYAKLARDYNEAGYEVVGMDLQGHGKSEGTRLFVRKFHDYVEDVVQFVRIMIEEEETKRGSDAASRVFLFGHSLGALIALHAANSSIANSLAGVMLSSPLIGQSSKAGGVLSNYLYRTFGDMMPQMAIAPAYVTVNSSVRSAQARDWLKNDPLRSETRVCMRTGSEILLAQRDVPNLVQAISKSPIPVLVLFGSQDYVVPDIQDTCREIFSSSNSTGDNNMDGSRFQLARVESAWHDMWFEGTANEQVIVDDPVPFAVSLSPSGETSTPTNNNNKLTEDEAELQSVPDDSSTSAANKLPPSQFVVSWMTSALNKRSAAGGFASFFSPSSTGSGGSGTGFEASGSPGSAGNLVSSVMGAVSKLTSRG